MAQTNTNVIIAFDETIFDELFFDVVVVVSNMSTILQLSVVQHAVVVPLTVPGVHDWEQAPSYKIVPLELKYWLIWNFFIIFTVKFISFNGNKNTNKAII